LVTQDLLLEGQASIDFSVSATHLSGLKPDAAGNQLPDADRSVAISVGRYRSPGQVRVSGWPLVYTGSAKHHIDARIAHHLCQKKALRWHIDYLLAAPGARVVDVIRSGRSECMPNRTVRGRNAVAGFGASDCSAGSDAHLKYLS
jgi:Uri superfamily endonuclease